MDPTTDDGRRAIDLERTALGRYRTTNARGGTIDVGTGEDADFTPVELLLVAIAACSAVDVDHLVSRRAEPDRFAVTGSGTKLRDEQGNHMGDLAIVFDVDLPDGESGDAARSVLPSAVRTSHDRLCTVSRTVEIGTPVDARVAD